MQRPESWSSGSSFCLVCPLGNKRPLGVTKLACWSTGPIDHILGKNKKNILKNFDRLAF